MPVNSQDLRVEQGSTFQQKTIFLDNPPNTYPGSPNLGNPTAWIPQDLTGVTAKMTIAQSQSPTGLVLLSLTSSPVAGITMISETIIPGPPQPSAPDGYMLTITSAQSTGIPPGVYYYDLYLDFPDGTQYKYQDGSITIVAGIGF